jgi:flagellin
LEAASSTNIDDILSNGDLINSTTYNGSQMTTASSGAFTAATDFDAYDGSTDSVTVTNASGVELAASNYSVADDGTVSFTGDGIAADTYTITYQDNSDTPIQSTTDVVLAANGTENTVLSGWSELDQTASNHGISVLDTAIKSLAKTIQQVGDDQARLSSKEESLSLGISNTEATRSRIEDADFAKEQMEMMKLSVLQQTTLGSFAQANSSAQMVLALFQ